jgi:hypothetical protein
MHNGFCRMLIAYVVCCGMLACTSSHDVEASGQALFGGTGGTVSTSGTGGSQAGRSGVAGGAGRAAGGSGGGAAAVSCGGATCPGTNIFGVALPACCTTDDKCGVDLASVGFAATCQEANAPGNANPACPSQTVAGILPLSGCCRPDGTCGALDNLFGLGCISVSTGAPSCSP